MLDVQSIDGFLVSCLTKAGIRVDTDSTIPKGSSIDPDVLEHLRVNKEVGELLSKGHSVPELQEMGYSLKIVTFPEYMEYLSMTDPDDDDDDEVGEKGDGDNIGGNSGEGVRAIGENDEDEDDDNEDDEDNDEDEDGDIVGDDDQDEDFEYNNETIEDLRKRDTDFSPLGRIRLGGSPEPYDDVVVFHPDRRKEPVMWTAEPCGFGWDNHALVYCRRNWVIKESFVAECYEGRLECGGNPADILTRLVKKAYYKIAYPNVIY